MIAHIIAQIVVVLIAIAGITQTIIFKKARKGELVVRHCNNNTNDSILHSYLVW